MLIHAQARDQGDDTSELLAMADRPGSPFSAADDSRNVVYVTGLRGIPDVQGGIERHCQCLYPRIVRRGFKVVLTARRGYVRENACYDFEGVHIRLISTLRGNGYEALFHTFRSILSIRKSGGRLLHLHGIGPALCTPLAKLLGMKVVVTHHGFDYRREKWGLVARTILKMGEAMALRFADTLICISEEIHAFARAKGARAKLVKIPNGVPPAGPVPGPDLVAKLGLQARRYVLLTARFVPEKGILDLLNAWMALPDHRGCQLAIAGDEDVSSDFGRKVRELAARDPSIVLTGRLGGETLRAIYAHAKGFILPSYHEGLPISLLEAMSWNLPVFASDIEANLEVKLPPDRYFRPGDIEAITSVLGRIVTEEFPDEDHSVAIRERYDWSAIADRTTEVYRDLVGATSSRASASRGATGRP